MKENNLKFECLAIGSLPHKSAEEAMSLVEKYFYNVPFWPQLSKLNRNEDMIFQFLEKMPGVVVDTENDRVYLDSESEECIEALENLFMDYEEAISDLNSDSLEKYEITETNSKTFKHFIKLVEKIKPNYAKGQIVGPFTLSTSLTDKEGRCAYYDETLREIIVKTLSLKALWQIKQIKNVSPETTPIIFIDEPTLSQLGTSAFVTIPPMEIVKIIKEISDLIKENGGLSAIHCCGKCDWELPMKTEMNIINFDAFLYAQNMSLFYKELKPFLENGGKIAWGVVPTLDKDALQKTDLDEIIKKFDNAVNLILKKGMDKNLIYDNSIITPACGAGALSVELAEKALRLTKELSNNLKER